MKSPRPEQYYDKTEASKEAEVLKDIAECSKTRSDYIATEVNVDNAFCMLFNAVMQSTSSGDLPVKFRVPFEKRGTYDVARARRIVSTWSPTQYEATADPKAFLQKYSFSKFFKRFLSFEESSKAHERLLQAKSCDKFLLLCEDGLRFDDYSLSNPDVEVLLDMMSEVIDDTLGDFDQKAVYNHCKHGPNSTYDLPLYASYEHNKGVQFVGTRHSLQQFWHYLQWDHTLCSELVETSDEWRAFINALIIPESAVVDCVDQRFVPKTFDTLRAMQPFLTVPAFLSQGIGQAITERLVKVGIDLTSQPDVHKNLARLASLYPEMDTATVDWSEASDRIWTCLVKRVFSGNAEPWYNFMANCCRCTYVRLEVKLRDCQFLESFLGEVPPLGLKTPISWFEDMLHQFSLINKFQLISTEKYEYELIINSPMFATMGNPMTFPLETLLFYAYLTACSKLAARRLLRNPYYSSAKINDFYVSSFGDDGIVSSQAMPEIEYFSNLIGWKLNKDKSYFSGAFRESCGGDYYMGLGCRPVMLDRPPVSFHCSEKENKLRIQAWLYVAANATCDLVVSLGYDTSFIDQWLAEMHKLFKLGKICVVPPSYPEGSGLRCMFYNFGWVGPHEVDLQSLLDGNVFHLPTFEVVPDSPVLRQIVFHCLQSVPKSWDPSVSDFDPITKRVKVYVKGSSWYYWAPRNWEFFYYIRALRKPVDDFYKRRSFFSTTLKTRAVLRAGGTLSIKECRLTKLYSSILSWC